MIRGIDTDNYDGLVPEHHFRWLYDTHAVRFNIIGLEARMPFARQQKEACEAAGIMVPFAYKFLYWRDDDLERMKDACRFGEPIAIDCEADTTWSPDRVMERIGEAKDLLTREGLYWGIYTGEWWWSPKTRNSTDCATDKLWHAAYPFGNQLPPENYMPPEGMQVDYGGWVEAQVHQYADQCYGDDAGPWAFDMNAADESLLDARVVPAGVGAHYTDGSDEEIWTPREGKTLDGVGMRYSNGVIERLWPQ